MLELYHNDMSVCAQKVRMVLAEKNLSWRGPNLNLRKGEQFAPEFLKISPKALVPVLIDDGRVFNESTAIIEYLNEKFPGVGLMPRDVGDRAIVRKWLIQIDAGLHVDVATLSFAIAFRHQVLAVHDTDAKLEAFLASIPDPRRAMMIAGMVREGFHFIGVKPAVMAYDKLLADMEKVLTDQAWLVGNELSLADITYAPYITRLAHLQLQDWWADKPAVTDWYQRIQQTIGYQKGLADWINPDYLALMADKGKAAWPVVADLLQR